MTGRVPMWAHRRREMTRISDHMIRTDIPCEKCNFMATGIKMLKQHFYDKHSY